MNLSKEYSILATVLDKMQTKAQDSFHSINENILNSSLFGSEKSNHLSKIDEEKESSELARSKRDISPLNNNNFRRASKFFNLSQMINSQNAFNHSQNNINNHSNIIENNSEESLDLTLNLDFNNVSHIQSLLPPIQFLKTMKEDDFSIIISENHSISDEDLEISLNFIIGQMEDIPESKNVSSFKLEDLLEESNKIVINDQINNDNAILEISSYMIKSEDSSQTNFVIEKVSLKRKFIIFLKIVFSRKFLKRKEIKIFLLFYISLFNAFYVPLNLIFDTFNYPPEITVLECLNVCYLSYLFSKKATKYIRALKRKKSNHQMMNPNTKNDYKLTKDDENAIILLMKSKSQIYLTLFIDFLYVIPFPMIISYCGKAHTVFFLFNIFRLINLKFLIRGLDYLKEKNGLFASILQILLFSIVFIHLFACILIALAFSQANFNESFLRRLPAPLESFSKVDRLELDVSNSSIYIDCLYWVYATVAKSGVMEMQVVSIEERVFSIVVMTVGGLFYIFVFGNMVSLVEDLTPKMKSILEKQEKKVLKFVRNLKMKGLERKVESYFNHIWKSDKGFNENEWLENLPTAIKVDIEKCQYLPIFKKSKFFSHGRLIPRPDASLIYSLFKFMKYEIFLPEDLIIIAGDYCSRVYFILEGRVELMSFDMKNKIVLQSGDFFGGIQGFERQVSVFLIYTIIYYYI